MQNRKTFSLLFSVVPCLILLVVFLVLGSSARAQATTRYVAPGGDCGEASPCYATIQAAVDDATDGDTIKACQGTYTTLGLAVVSISKAITVTGGYTTTDWVHSFPITQATVIDAENAARRRGITINGTEVATITLQALTIQHGNAQDTSAGGGGIYVVTGSLVLEDSSLLNNRASGDGNGGYGGGVYLGGGQHIVSNTVLQGNQAASGGGGIHLAGGRLLVNNTAFRENSADMGGGLHADDVTHLTVRECMFLNNSAQEGGG